MERTLRRQSTALLHRPQPSRGRAPPRYRLLDRGYLQPEQRRQGQGAAAAAAHALSAVVAAGGRVLFSPATPHIPGLLPGYPRVFLAIATGIIIS